MNIEQFDRLRAALAKDCEITGVLMDDNGRTCALGCIAREMGIELAANTALSMSNGFNIFVGLQRALGISLADVVQIMRANDESPTIAARRARVLAVWDTLRPTE